MPSLLNILLADDDQDDCMLFKEALEELPFSALLTTVHSGDKLMKLLNGELAELPDVLFLDLNMPRKNGHICLSEIKGNERLNHIPVVIYSTSYEQEITNELYKEGANYYLQKPGDFLALKQAINKVIMLISENKNAHTTEEKFLING